MMKLKISNCFVLVFFFISALSFLGALFYIGSIGIKIAAKWFMQFDSLEKGIILFCISLVSFALTQIAISFWNKSK